MKPIQQTRTALQDLPPPTQARGGDLFPELPVVSHRKQGFNLYSDLIRGHVVTINFMSVADQDFFPVMENLGQIAKRLGSRLGQDVVMCTITTDPARDTPERLAQLAVRYEVPEGWHLLTAPRRDIESLSRRLHRHGNCDCHYAQVEHPVRMVHYGNGEAGVWGAFGVDSNPDFAVERLTWVRAGSVPAGPPRQAGPRRLDDSATYHNRVL